MKAAFLAAVVAAGCTMGTQPVTPPATPATAVQPTTPPRPADAPGAVVNAEDGTPLVAGEAVVALAPGAQPPATAGQFRCTPGPWSGPRVLLMRCAPAPDAASTRALLEALRRTPGVESADFNYVRRRLD